MFPRVRHLGRAPTLLRAARRGCNSRAPVAVPVSTPKALRISRAAEVRRFGLPLWKLFGVGAVGVALVARWWYQMYCSAWPDEATEAISCPAADEIVHSDEQAAALFADVRRVLARHGLDLGRVRIAVQAADDLAVEGLTHTRRVGGRRRLRAPRRIELIEVRAGMPAVRAARVLAHEFMHAWLWLHDFPPLSPAVEEGLCELTAFAYLLMLLNEPAESELHAPPALLRRQLASIERNAHVAYGPGFRDAAVSLRGLRLHELLSYVREHARLPEPSRPPPVREQARERRG